MQTVHAPGATANLLLAAVAADGTARAQRVAAAATQGGKVRLLPRLWQWVGNLSVRRITLVATSTTTRTTGDNQSRRCHMQARRHCSHQSFGKGKIASREQRPNRRSGDGGQQRRHSTLHQVRLRIWTLLSAARHNRQQQQQEEEQL